MKLIVSQAKKLIRLDDMSASRKLSGNFHFTVVEAAKNSTLARVYKVAVNSFPDWMLYQAMFEHPDELEQSVKEEYKEHLAIAEAIERATPTLPSNAPRNTSAKSEVSSWHIWVSRRNCLTGK